MKAFKRDNAHILILEVGESVVESVIRYCSDNEIKAASVSGIGAVSNVTIGYFDCLSKMYKKKALDGSFELVNLSGNIATKDDEIIFHPHVTLGAPGFNLIGGHLFEGTISVTGEIFIFPVKGKLIRERDRETSLYLVKGFE